MFLSNLIIKSSIAKKIENNIFEGMAILILYYILLLFDFQNKQKYNVNLNYVTCIYIYPER